MAALQHWIASLGLPAFLVVGIVSLAAVYVGKAARLVRLPSIIGFMITGAVLGPSVLDLLSETLQEQLSFVTELALGFVAVSIGIELSFKTLKRLGTSIVWIILGESFLAFIVVTVALYLLTGDLALALIFGAIAPASAPAGTVAVIKEYKARGSLTNALYAVVGFDDGLGIIIYGFASAIAASILSAETGAEVGGFLELMGPPLLDMTLSIVLGIVAGFLFSLPARKARTPSDVFVLLVPFVFIIIGLCDYFDFSFILTNMVMGIYIVNTQGQEFIRRLREEISNVMPYLFVLFFTLAGANLHIAALGALGVLGVVYMAGRSGGLMLGAWLGAVIGRAEAKIRKYLGMGILSQAGVAIGLSLIVKEQLGVIGPAGQRIGAMVITTIAATSIIFEIIGPTTTKIGLTAAGEIERSP